MRLLEGDLLLPKSLVIQSLQRGPVPPSGASPCTHTPGRGRGRCTLTQMNVAGQIVAQAPPSFPANNFAVESNNNNESTRHDST
ncbi:hypothetical protein Tsubulata_005871 [Turnera subulata]|uniref:Uncharacterized protein n=1 Tax=Turnera subulata TaxID=218843 RepID=A0A9Q0G2Z2_9ROSI|nr:hypothetical protein Tsubulata_005871 [Turnera subulata]